MFTLRSGPKCNYQDTHTFRLHVTWMRYLVFGHSDSSTNDVDVSRLPIRPPPDTSHVTRQSLSAIGEPGASECQATLVATSEPSRTIEVTASGQVAPDTGRLTVVAVEQSSQHCGRTGQWGWDGLMSVCVCVDCNFCAVSRNPTLCRQFAIPFEHAHARTCKAERCQVQRLFARAPAAAAAAANAAAKPTDSTITGTRAHAMGERRPPGIPFVPEWRRQAAAAAAAEHAPKHLFDAPAPPKRGCSSNARVNFRSDCRRRRRRRRRRRQRPSFGSARMRRSRKMLFASHTHVERESIYACSATRRLILANVILRLEDERPLWATAPTLERHKKCRSSFAYWPYMLQDRPRNNLRRQHTKTADGGNL